MQQSKEILKLVDMGVLEDDNFSEWASPSPTFAIPKKRGISYNKSYYQFQEAQLIVET
jgi:hypothetical protein